MKSNTDTAEKPLACIVVLNYNGLEHFAYCEENDFQIRVRKAGYKVVVINVQSDITELKFCIQ